MTFVKNVRPVRKAGIGAIFLKIQKQLYSYKSENGTCAKFRSESNINRKWRCSNHSHSTGMIQTAVPSHELLSIPVIWNII
jgi:hypothetical protein